ncbi:MAG: aldo/keto reductase [Gammaproteobacteria bacterium SHHR-1]
MQRREFFKHSVASAAALGTGLSVPQAWAQADGKAQVRSYRRLGRTGMKISDISFGAGKLPSAGMVLRAIDRGINYFDTAPDYGRSEEYLGQALKRLKQRDKVYIVSKFCDAGPYVTGKSHLQPGVGKAAYKKAVEDSLKRLNTDYLDAVFVHAMGEGSDLASERRRLLDEDMLAAFAELKAEGKARALAVSSHGPHGMEELLLEAVNSSHYDLIMPAFNFMKFPRVPEVIKAAQAKDVGVVAMKTLAGARAMDLDLAGASFEQAAFKWVLQHPQVAGLVVTMRKVSDLDNYLPASGQALSALDQQLLDRYAGLHGRDYCRTGCGDCEASCPLGISIASILRFQMYFEDYGQEKDAMSQYAQLDRKADGCQGCADAPCNQACPHELAVSAKLRDAHRSLSFG